MLPRWVGRWAGGCSCRGQRQTWKSEERREDVVQYVGRGPVKPGLASWPGLKYHLPALTRILSSFSSSSCCPFPTRRLPSLPLLRARRQRSLSCGTSCRGPSYRCRWVLASSVWLRECSMRHSCWWGWVLAGCACLRECVWCPRGTAVGADRCSTAVSTKFVCGTKFACSSCWC